MVTPPAFPGRDGVGAEQAAGEPLGELASLGLEPVARRSPQELPHGGGLDPPPVAMEEIGHGAQRQLQEAERIAGRSRPPLQERREAVADRQCAVEIEGHDRDVVKAFSGRPRGLSRRVLLSHFGPFPI